MESGQYGWSVPAPVWRPQPQALTFQGLGILMGVASQAVVGGGNSGGVPWPRTKPGGTATGWNCHVPLRQTSLRKGCSCGVTRPAVGAKTPVNVTGSAAMAGRPASSRVPRTKAVSFEAIGKRIIGGGILSWDREASR